MKLELFEVTGSVPASCILPTELQPVRVAEWDDLLSRGLGARRVDSCHAEVMLPGSPEIAARVASLAYRENECCSFFSFVVRLSPGSVVLELGVPASQTAVLEALVAKVGDGLSASS